MGKKKSTANLLQVDPKYRNKLAGKFINNLMWEGKKSVAQKIFYDALDDIKKKLPDEDPFDVFTTAIENAKPSVEVRSKRVGGATYQVPMPVNPKRQQSLAIRWLLSAVRKKKGKPAYQRLSNILLGAYRQDKECEALKTKENVHKMAEANKAFAHFAKGM